MGWNSGGGSAVGKMEILIKIDMAIGLLVGPVD
jgi:hypothetical protein